MSSQSFVKVIGDANGQDANDTLEEHFFWGPHRPQLISISSPPLPISHHPPHLTPASHPSESREAGGGASSSLTLSSEGVLGKVCRDKKRRNESVPRRGPALAGCQFNLPWVPERSFYFPVLPFYKVTNL